MATRLYVGNIPYKTDEQDMRDFFSPRVLAKIDIIVDHLTGRVKGFAFVEMSDDEASDAVDKLDGLAMGGRTIKVAFAKAREGKGQPSSQRRQPERGRERGNGETRGADRRRGRDKNYDD